MSTPLYKEGDAVQYVPSPYKDTGRVVKVVEHTTYTYKVEWDDQEPTDEYPADRLSPASDFPVEVS